jgi:diacylglycerol kinase family enzyme
MADDMTPFADTSLKPRRLRVLLNAAAGTASRSGGETLGEKIAASFLAHGIVAEIPAIAAGGLAEAATQAREMLKQGALDAVVAGGGDGTISTVAGAMAGTDYPMGLLPLGTLNHFARDLNIPLDLDEAVAVIVAGATRRVDVAEANGRIFINNSSIGLYPRMVLDRERQRHPNMPKWLAMIPAMLRTLWNLPVRRLTITAAGRTETFRSPCVFIGNNGYRLSGAAVGERDRLDEGRLCLYIARSQGRRALLGLVLRALLGWLDSTMDLQSLAVASVAISSRRKRLLASFDGEIEIVRTPIRYAIKPGALRVFAGAAPRDRQ